MSPPPTCSGLMYAGVPVGAPPAAPGPGVTGPGRKSASLLHTFAVGDHVAGLEVAVDQAQRMCVAEPDERPFEHPQRLLGSEEAGLFEDLA